MIDAVAALKELAGEFRIGDKVKVAIAKAAREAGLNYWRAFNLYYGKVKPTEREAEQLELALRRKRYVADKNEFAEIKARMAILEARMAQTDAEFHGEDIAAIRQSLRVAR